jgi:hypothetical protein
LNEKEFTGKINYSKENKMLLGDFVGFCGGRDLAGLIKLSFN